MLTEACSFLCLLCVTLCAFVFKGIVHSKIKIHSLSTDHYADGGVGEVFESTKHVSGGNSGE